MSVSSKYEQRSSVSRTLLSRLRSNEDEAWNHLVDLYGPMVLAWCRKSRLGEADVADVFQEVFRAVATHIRSFRRSRPEDSFRAWLRVITKNKLTDHFRRLQREPRAGGGSTAQRRMQELAAPETDDEVEDDAAGREDAELELFRRALEPVRDRFHEKTWRAFWRTVVDGQSPKDVADELEMTSGAVRVAKSRVLQRLRDELGDLDI